MSPMIQFKATILSLMATFVLGFVLLPLAQAKQQSEDRGNANSAAENVDALNLSTTGTQNTAHGWFSLFSNTSGLNNTADGFQALYSNTTGDSNTATGSQALFENSSGSFNTATGVGALHNNTTVNGSTAYGYQALYSNIEGVGNTAVGYRALYSNVGLEFAGGFGNTAVGSGALFSNGQGAENTAVGDGALYSNLGDPAFLSGWSNTAVGSSALDENTNGRRNTAVGANTLGSNTTGSDNTAIGTGALLVNDTGSGNTALGVEAGLGVTTASNVICIGANVAGANVSNTTWIGNVYGVTTQSGTTAPVIVSDTGQLGTVASSQRFKKDIATMDKASDAILSLRPVTFHYKSDTKNTPQFGLIAEEVAKVNPALVLPDKTGKPFTVRYDAVNAMLLNEFLKAHKKIEEQEATIAQLKTELQTTAANQQKQIESLTAGLQKVSAQLEVSKPAPETVLNGQ